MRKVLIMLASEVGFKIQYKLNGIKGWNDAPVPCWNWYQFDFRIKFFSRKEEIK